MPQSQIDCEWVGNGALHAGPFSLEGVDTVAKEMVDVLFAWGVHLMQGRIARAGEGRAEPACCCRATSCRGMRAKDKHGTGDTYATLLEECSGTMTAQI